MSDARKRAKSLQPRMVEMFDAGVSVSGIARELGVKKATVDDHLHRVGRKRLTAAAQAKADAAYALCVGGASLAEAAAQMGVSERQVVQWLGRAGYRLGSVGRRHRFVGGGSVPKPVDMAEVWKMKHRGWSVQRIARTVGVSGQTIRRRFRAEAEKHERPRQP